MIEGTLTIELENGTRREFPPRTIFVEAFGTRHHGMNAGSAPAKVLFIDHSEEGQSNVVKTEAPDRLTRRRRATSRPLRGGDCQQHNGGFALRNCG